MSSKMYQTYHKKNRSKPKRTISKAVVGCTRDFCLETSIHGFNHIASPNRHWFERVLWACVTVAAIWGAVEISLGQLQRYNENPTVVALEKDFRTWIFTLPAITGCDKNRVNPKKLPEVIKALWDVEITHEKYTYYSKFVTTVANSDLLHLQGYQEFKDDESLEVDLYQLAVDVALELQVKATWSDDVARAWTPVMTEAGVCYAVNSLAIADTAIKKPDPNETKTYPLTCKYSALSCYVILEIGANADFYVHSPYDVMDITIPPSRVILTLNRKTELSVTETGSSKRVRALSPQRRGCRHTDEPSLGNRQVFSTNTCRLSCRSKLAIKLCGCRPFYYFYDDGTPCSTKGMACLSAHAQQLASNAGTRCACSQQCQDATFKEISNVDQYWDKGPFQFRGSVRLTVQAPRIRYTREIVFHFQDLVVSFGGAAGLFLGASFISFVEIFYFLLERFLRVFVKKKDDQVLPVKIKHSIPYEAARIDELTTILDGQRRYYSNNNKQYY